MLKIIHATNQKSLDAQDNTRNKPKVTPEQIARYAEAKELRIDLPEKYLTDKQLAKRYHLERGDASEDGAEDKPDLFYNIDLRSFCGHMGEPWGQEHDIILFPKYYAKG